MWVHRERNLRRLLIAATRTVNRRITGELQRRGYENTRPGHTMLLANLDKDGNSVTEVAERAQISKQSMARLAVELEELKLITRRPSQVDRRELVLCFTAAGRKLIRETVAIVDTLENSLAQEMGADLLAQLKAGLTVIARAG